MVLKVLLQHPGVPAISDASRIISVVSPGYTIYNTTEDKQCPHADILQRYSAAKLKGH